MKEYNKLVRDKIPEIISNDNKKFDMHTVDNDEAIKLLSKKLNEEVSEFQSNNNIEELADIIEVAFSLAKKLGYSEEELIKARDEKREKRGSFDKNIVLDRVYE